MGIVSAAQDVAPCVTHCLRLLSPEDVLLCVLSTLPTPVMQFVNPYHLWMLWDPEVRFQRRCLARHNEIISEAVTRLRRNPPASHTIAGVLVRSAAAEAPFKPFASAVTASKLLRGQSNQGLGGVS